MKTPQAILAILLVCMTAARAQSVSNQHSQISVDELAAQPTSNWLTHGGSLSNQHYSPLDKIDRSNVANLKGIWRVHLDGSGIGPRFSNEAQPLVHNGVAYIVTGENDAFAVNLKNGAMLWKYEASLPADLGKSICCGWSNRGLALGDGKVFVGRLDSKLVALDQLTGKVAWEVQAAPWQEGYSITGAPLFYDGNVIVGFAGAEYGIRGVVKAFSADTGEERWAFHTVPGPGEFGHDTWPQNSSVWEHGGGSVWNTPAVDPASNLLYFATGNPGPGSNGAVRAGDNLFTASVVAIDPRSGEYRWHFQEVHHDIWDYDGANPVVLFDVEIAGVQRKAVAHAGKTGWVYILDRLTGEPLIGIEERAVPQEPTQLTAATQPFPTGDAFVPQYVDVAPEGAELVNSGKIFTPFGPTTTTMIQPGTAGGANWPPSAYDPVRQTLFICGTESAMTLGGGGDPTMPIPERRDGNFFIGGKMGAVSKVQRGMVAAMDMTTNTLKWHYRWAETCFSGFTATAGGLLFVGRNDGRMTALDSDTGKELWSFMTDAGLNAPVAVFEDSGKQYVLAYSAGNFFAGSTRGDSLWLFGLEGTMDEVTQSEITQSDNGASSQTAAGETATTGDPNLASGEAIYKSTCLPCHGADGLGGHNGAKPLNSLKSINQAVDTVRNGRNDMPKFNGVLTQQQILDVGAFVLATFALDSQQ
jgi:quinohemoprotein ethanol dehydrogenase